MCSMLVLELIIFSLLRNLLLSTSGVTDLLVIISRILGALKRELVPTGFTGFEFLNGTPCLFLYFRFQVYLTELTKLRELTKIIKLTKLINLTKFTKSKKIYSKIKTINKSAVLRCSLFPDFPQRFQNFNNT